jgi:hypothetical protein
MANVQVVADESTELNEVRQLWRANSDTLGFYTKGAFAERAQKGQILAAIDSGRVVGYILYYTDKRSTVIVIQNPRPFPKPVELPRLREEWDDFHPPQSYRYLTDPQINFVWRQFSFQRVRRRAA